MRLFKKEKDIKEELREILNEFSEKTMQKRDNSVKLAETIGNITKETSAKYEGVISAVSVLQQVSIRMEGLLQQLLENELKTRESLEALKTEVTGLKEAIKDIFGLFNEVLRILRIPLENIKKEESKSKKELIWG